ncbi:MAG: hypothetical protein CL845_02070 [Crocinitomicaceae bacterium]|nr:hypothetical protein [Crocinitomicaceae bacterium]|tara:strand:- start:516 stop:1457 length:942 start_codon:yes stop_codon:yes gene_type:complete
MRLSMRFVPVVILFLSGSIGLAQHTPLSTGFVIGGSNYLGEIGGKFEPRASLLDANIITTSPTIGGFLRYAANDRVRISGEVNYVHIRQADHNADDPARQARNLNFRNRMVEFGFRTDFMVFRIADRSTNRNFSVPGKLFIRGFVFTGAYGVLHNPQAQITYDPDNEWENRWYDLRPLRTEGQVEEYASLIAAIPLGFGIEFGLGYGWVLGFEGSWRSTFTDYLDDISGMYANPDFLSPLAEAISSQSNEAVIAAINNPASGNVQNHQYHEGGTYRGNPDTNDSYGTLQITVARIIDTRSSFERALDHISSRR